jgi:DDE superfamily endonuclease
VDETLVFLFKKWRHLLWPGDLGRIRRNLKHWSERISSHIGAPVKCFGFIDGTSRRMCAPGGQSIVQESCFDGHHRMHAMAYHGLVAPDGLFIHAYGPFTGNRSDQYILSESGLPQMAEEGEFKDEDGNEYFFFGDLGYSPSLGVLSGFKEATGVFKAFNRVWSR